MKQRITVTVDSDSYQLLKAYDVNISGLVSTTLQNEARRLRAERWQAENQEGMAEVARFIEMNRQDRESADLGSDGQNGQDLDWGSGCRRCR